MQKPTWTVIQFMVDNTVEAVPSGWIEHNKCYWPSFKYEQIIAAIRKNVERNTCWPSYDVITFRNSTYDDYNMARLKTKKAECTSDLNSEVEKNAKRKRLKNRLYESSDDTDDSDKESSVRTKQKEIKEGKIVNKKVALIQSSSEESDEFESTLSKPPQITETINIKKNLNSNTKGSEQTPSTSTHNLQNNTNDICKDAFFSNAPHLFTDNNDNAKYFKEIIRQQSYFKTQLWQMADDLRKIKDAIITGNLMRQNQDNQRQNEKSIYHSFDLPLKTVEDIEEAVEQFLKIKENFKRSTTDTCSIGGTSPYNFIKRNLCRLISNELAQKYSWLGAKLKRKFCNLQITKMLLAAGIEYSNSTYTEIELEKSIQKWLKRAKERYDAERKKLEAHENDQ
ncbi:PREDICTED: uncharacterized protein LOC105450618 [Wasmannia auropunctata]|uniref:uncharacterized protein LOC105450618 n=1 Tax=Wasmannia auropunctata TaxID=64793 RepID=UPI0005ED9128|nr:PREDICTED: uncharacterized protein LOC105450618 [Wasmannia auropunctata]